LAWHAKELVRSIYDDDNAKLVVQFVDRLGHDLPDEPCPKEVRSLGRTLLRCRGQVAAWHRAYVSNGPTEAANNLIKRVKRAEFELGVVPQLPDQRTALRGQAQLFTARDAHP